MIENILKKGSFVSAAIRDNETVYILCTNDESSRQRIPHSVLMQWDSGEFGHIEQFNSYCAGIDVLRGETEQLIAVSEVGDVIVFGSGESYKEKISIPGKSITSYGPLRKVRVIDNSLIVVGSRNCVYERLSKSIWQDISPGNSKNDKPNMTGFESVDGFDLAQIYAVGWNGAICMRDNYKWFDIDSPTNAILTDVCCAGDGMVYACGQAGLLLRGKENKWEVIEMNVKFDFWNARWFHGFLYLSSYQGVFRLNQEKLELVEISDVGTVDTFNISVYNNLMWSVGAKDIMQFDNKSWTRIA